MNIRDFQIATQNRDLEWDPKQQLTTTFRATEFAGEVGELCNVIKKLERQRLGLPGSRSTKEALAEEIGDCLVTLMLLANSANIDVETAAIKKFNATSEKIGLHVFIG